jgi:hypothetical protein
METFNHHNAHHRAATCAAFSRVAGAAGVISKSKKQQLI